jgi:putative hydroxymethylpyrimidine transporter CytX
MSEQNTHSTAHHTPLSPVNPNDRVFTGLSHASLWFSLGVGLLVMQVGSYLVPAMGTRDALMAIVIGSIIGAGLLAWVAKIGCDSGLTSAGLIHHVYGQSFAKLPVMLNIVQLVGWTTFELVVMREGTQAITQKAFGVELSTVWTTLLWGGILILLMTGSMLTLVRRFVSRFGLPLVILSLLWLSWHFVGVAQQQGLDALLARPGTGAMSMLSAVDLVMAMPISWLPLVADFARHGTSGRSTLRGTWLGYALANTWCYTLGVLVASVSEPGTDLVAALLLAQGGLLALGLILLDELDNAYGDVYSGAVSSRSLYSAWSLRRWGMLIAAICTALAMVLPMHSLEPFLLTLSSIFVPLYGVILGRLCSGAVVSAGLTNPVNAGKRVDVLAAGIWISGIAVFHASAQLTPQLGAAVPSLIFTFALAMATRPSIPKVAAN